MVSPTQEIRKKAQKHPLIKRAVNEMNNRSQEIIKNQMELIQTISAERDAEDIDELSYKVKTQLEKEKVEQDIE